MDDLNLFTRTEAEQDSQVQSAQIYSNNVKMEFRLSKYAPMVKRRGNLVSTECIWLPSGKTGILETNGIKHYEMEEKTRTRK